MKLQTFMNGTMTNKKEIDLLENSKHVQNAEDNRLIENKIVAAYK